jgi:hypothetical protein
MPAELALDFLSVSRLDDPPDASIFSRAIAAAGFGMAEYSPASHDESAGRGGRRRLGVYSLRAARGATTGRLVVARHDRAVLAAMADPAFNVLSRGLDPEDRRTLREGRVALDLRVTSPHPSGGEHLIWATRVLLVLLGLTEGVAMDPATQSCYGRVDLARVASNPGPLAHVVTHAEPWGSDAFWLHTHGVQKFGRPEVEIVGVPRSFEVEGRALLADLAESLARGDQLAAGQEVDLGDVGRLVAVATPTDVDHQAPFGRLRLVDAPAPGEQLGETPSRVLARWVLGDATARADRGDLPGALEIVERALAADPDDGAAQTLKARLLLRAGQPLEALQVGELMELRLPRDWRGPLVIGHALAALGRPTEARNAYTRSIELNPDDGEAFAARAAILDQLGEPREAAADRSRAAYLSV